MGEVYRARDTKLNRQVAIKVLPGIFAGDPERLARFEREAQALASLNHPNVAQIYGVIDSPPALVMECVEGEDLARRLLRGALPLDETLPIARQIAEALEAAHEQGVVHRDLKPANIMVSPDGVVKVLDFGLAKAISGTSDGHRSSEPVHGLSPANLQDSPTFASPMRTQMGIVLGTAAYMAPEQARGKSADRRADIWAFGLVVYEMLTGHPTFGGEEISDVLAAVLRQEIAWQALPADTPPRLRRLLDRCLERDPKLRLRDIGEARVDLTRIEAGAVDLSGPGVAPVSAIAARRSVLPVIAVAVGAIAVVVALAMWWSARREEPLARVARVSLLPPAGISLYPDSTGVAISPDGTMVAFVVGAITRSETELWVRSLDSMTARRLDGGDGANLPFWSPDSRHIGFFTGSKLKSIAASGGRAEIICDAYGGGRGAAWNASNVIVFAPDASGPLFRVSANGGTPVQITQLDTSRKEYGHRFPAFLPDGDHFVYASLPAHNGTFDIYAASLSGGRPTLLGAMESAPVYADPGWLLYARQGVLVARAFDPKTLALKGDPIGLEDEPSAILDPQTSFTAGRPVSISTSGTLAYYSAPSINTVAEWYTIDGRRIGSLDVPPGHYDKVAIAPDGGHAVLVRSSSPSESALWLVDLARGSASPLASAPGRNDSPVWSPDGSQVVFAADGGGAADLFVKTVGDASPEKPLYRSDALFKNPSSWSPDGKWVIVTQLDPVTAQNIWLLPASGGALTRYIEGPTRDDGIAVSPDGHWFAYISDDTSRFQLYLQSFPTPGHKIQVSQAGAFGAWWSGDGRELLFLGDDVRTVWKVQVNPGPALSLGTPVQVGQLPPGILWLDAMPDRQRLLTLAPERTGTGSMTLVQNWRGALDAKR
jgi:eukaryotic-like serine/threonine-protein kinase